MRRVVVILRPGATAEQVEELRSAIARVRAGGDRVDVRTGFEAGDGERSAAEAVRGGADLLIAAGGDGTLNAVVNGLAPFEPRPPLGIVPLGTANDFALGLGVPPGVADALDVALGEGRTCVDLAVLNDRWFINVSTGGFGAEATETAPPESKRLLGSWAYLITGARHFVELRPVTGEVIADDRRVLDGEFLMFAVGNARRTGGGSLLTPRAELNDGLLDLLVVRAMPRLDFLSMLPDLRAGTHLENPEVVYTRARAITITTADPLSVNADGEPVRGTRFVYRLDPTPMTIVTP